MARLAAVLALGLTSLAFAACEGASTPTSCGEPHTTQPPAGCGDTPIWVRLPETADCVQTWSGCAPAIEDDAFWMQFGSLVECQSITCKAGDTRPSGDGCNTCSCGSSSAPNLERGYWTCTNDACGSAVPTGKACGYWQGPCNSAEYCAFSPAQACSSFDAPSICITQPSECTDESAPVCACDGKTYPNRCEAARAGSGIRNFGPCPRAGNAVACGARAGATCTDAEYCAYVAGDLCGGADAEGTCQPRPAVCIEMDAPVCGCDGKTYANACEAAKVGTGVLNDGGCCDQ